MKSWIKFTAVGGVVTISANIQNLEITFVGASCSASVRHGSSDLTSFSLAPEVGKPAIVGVRTRYSSISGRTPIAHEGYMLLIGWDGNKAVCDLKEDFVPRIECLATVNQEGVLTLISGENKFIYASKCSNRETVDNHVADGFRELKDSAPAFRFINGDITLAQLLQEESNPTKLEVCTQKLTYLMQRVESLQTKLTLETEHKMNIWNKIKAARDIASNKKWGWRKKLLSLLNEAMR